MEFGPWHALVEADLAHAPAAGAAVQLRRAEGLVVYPRGKSAMVAYFYARTDARRALATLFEDELRVPGANGQGPLWFRVAQAPEAEAALQKLHDEFVTRFGAPPCLARGG